MGQTLTVNCGNAVGQQLLTAIRDGDVDLAERMLGEDSTHLNTGFFHDRQSPLHVAAFHGQLQVLSMLLERGANPNPLNSRGQTPLMLACKSGHWRSVERLLEAGASILTFDYVLARTCLHYACRRGHEECVRKILDAAQRGPVSQSWGFVRFVNVRDCRGTTALHLASRMGHVSILRLLLDNGALVSATTTTTGNGPGHGSSPIHYAARGGSLECVRELLAWGADRTQRDLTGYTPFGIAMKYNNPVCASILNPNGAEPLVWPSPWKFMSEGELEPEAKTLLEAALAKANEERDRENASQSCRVASSRSSRRGRKRQTLASTLTANQPVSGAATTPSLVTADAQQGLNGGGKAAEERGAPPSETADHLHISASPWCSPSPCPPPLPAVMARRRSLLEDAENTAARARGGDENEELEVQHQEYQQRKQRIGNFHNQADTGPCGASDDKNTESLPGVQEVCCICFEKFCTIEVMECGHQMCATCTLALCCHSKPNPAIPYSPPPSCPFCRRNIGHLILARPKLQQEQATTQQGITDGYRSCRLQRSDSSKSTFPRSDELSEKNGPGMVPR